MRSWLLVLGGLLAWAAQFFALYILASVFGSGMIARVGTILFTLAALAADGAILWYCIRRLRAAPADDFDHWLLTLALLVAGTSLVAILWQGLPALLI